MLEEALLKSHRVSVDWPTHTLSVDDEDTVLNESSLSLPMSGESSTPTMVQSDEVSSQVVLGTVLLWVGWLGFNGGSCFAASLKAALAIFNTNLAGSTGLAFLSGPRSGRSDM